MLWLMGLSQTIEISEIYFDKRIAFIPQGNIDLRFDTILKTCEIPNIWNI